MMTSTDELFEAIEAGDADRVRVIVAADPSTAAARDEEGVSALMRARYRRDASVTEAVGGRFPRSTCSRPRPSATWTA
jgi:hypothetical protein